MNPRSDENIRPRWWIGLLIAGVLLLLACGVLSCAYNMGLAQGVAQGVVQSRPVTPGTAPVPYGFWGGPFAFRPFGFGFGFLGCLFPLLVLVLLFALVRGFFWRGRAGWMGMHPRDWPNGVPPRVEEWHRRMHEAPSAPPQEPGAPA